MLTLFLEPLTHNFMVQGLAVSSLLGVLCAVVGTYLIVQQMAMMGNMISHAVLPGLSLAFFFNIDLAIGAFIAGALSALSVAAIHSQSRIKPDSAIALVLSGFLALGIILIKVLQTNRLNLDAILFGDILGVTPTDLWRTLGLTLLVLLCVKLFYKELLFYTFDPLGAQACGLPVTWLYLGLIAAMTLSITASMQTVGVLLVVSLLIAPSSTGYLLAKELHWVMGLGAIASILASLIGLYLSYYWALPTGPTIVLINILIFLAAFLFSPSQGILTQPETWHRANVLLRKIEQKFK